MKLSTSWADSLTTITLLFACTQELALKNEKKNLGQSFDLNEKTWFTEWSVRRPSAYSPKSSSEDSLLKYLLTF